MTRVQPSAHGDGSRYDMAESLIGETPVMREMRAFIAKVALSSLPVLIQGPTGSGKELVAGALHQQSGRRGSFIAFNVCALGESMFEDALFGHVRGAFTGAIGDSAGYLAEADKGTVFFDEIGGLSPSAQAKLLRVLETKQYRPVGGRHDRQSDFRLVAATNEDVDASVAAGHFRADLAFRLRGCVIHVPALDARRADIPLLARALLERAAPGGGLELSNCAVDRLLAYPWPGNVRELGHVIGRATVLSETRMLRAQAIDDALGGAWGAVAARGRADAPERASFLAVLERHGWDTTCAAAELGVTRKTIYARIQRLGLRIPKRHARRDRAMTGRLMVAECPHDSPTFTVNSPRHTVNPGGYENGRMG